MSESNMADSLENDPAGRKLYPHAQPVAQPQEQPAEFWGDESPNGRVTQLVVLTPLSDERIMRIAETLGAEVPGVSNYDSWGSGYRPDDKDEYTIPVVPAIAVRFARAILAAAGAKQAEPTP